MTHNFRTCLPILSVALAAQLLLPVPVTKAQTTTAPAPTLAAAELRIGGAVSTPLVLTAGDLKKMPRKTLPVVNPHSKEKETYEGVLLEELLRRAGVPVGDQLHGSSLAISVMAQGEDGYRVVFSLAELDSGILDSDVIVADTMNGAPLAAKQGPFRLVAPLEKRPARWVRMLRSITVITAPAQ